MYDPLSSSIHEVFAHFCVYRFGLDIMNIVIRTRVILDEILPVITYELSGF